MSPAESFLGTLTVKFIKLTLNICHCEYMASPRIANLFSGLQIFFQDWLAKVTHAMEQKMVGHFL